jgi:hypothetical protein
LNRHVEKKMWANKYLIPLSSFLLKNSLTRRKLHRVCISMCPATSNQL